jgi:superfamily II DNA or RNA helicase
MSLPTFHDYQDKALIHATEFLHSKAPALLMVSPTGTGKTLMQVAILERAHAAGLRGLQVVPTIEIGRGFAQWLGLEPEGQSDDYVRRALESVGVYTAKRLVNLLSAGEIDPTRWDFVQIDEAHHAVDDTHKAIDLYMGHKPRVGWTATDFRGTPQETNALLVWWANNVYRVLTETDAVARGFAAAPTTEVWPLVNDELISLSQGEFSTVGVEAATEDALEELVGTTGKKFWVPGQDLWDRPTMLTLTTKHLVEEAVRHFNHQGLPAVGVTGETSGRSSIFQDVIDRKYLLVQIKVVGEGVDLPLRRLIDAAPTMSPVFWRQRIGRIMRPVHNGEVPPAYIVTNHNLLRHGYLLKGVLPPRAFREAATAWGEDFKPSKRMVARAAGLVGLGRFVPNQVPLADGSFWWMFVLGSPTGEKQYAVLTNPAGGDPIYAVKKFLREEGEDGKLYKDYGRSPPWQRIKTVPDLKGYTSVPPDRLTPGRKRMWDNLAAFKGLDVDADVDARTFSVLPLLNDIGGKFRPGGELR